MENPNDCRKWYHKKLAAVIVHKLPEYEPHHDCESQKGSLELWYTAKLVRIPNSFICCHLVFIISELCSLN